MSMATVSPVLHCLRLTRTTSFITLEAAMLRYGEGSEGRWPSTCGGSQRVRESTDAAGWKTVQVILRSSVSRSPAVTRRTRKRYALVDTPSNSSWRELAAWCHGLCLRCHLDFHLRVAQWYTPSLGEQPVTILHLAAAAYSESLQCGQSLRGNGIHRTHSGTSCPLQCPSAAARAPEDANVVQYSQDRLHATQLACL